MDARAGDTIEVQSNQVGQPVRRGTVLEVIAEQPAELRVRWEDGHESVFYPHGGTVAVEHADES